MTQSECTIDPFQDCDRDVKITGRKVRVVKTRKVHRCLTPSYTTHDIPVGSMARFESAIVDGQPGSFYTCMDCINRILEVGTNAR
jgi:hypothetical protein